MDAKRKDRCRDKLLFDFGKNRTFYKIDNDKIASVAVPNYADTVLLRRLQRYQEEHRINKPVYEAAQLIIDALKEQSERFTTVTPYSREHLAALRMAIADRIAGKTGNPVAYEREIHQAIRSTLDDIFLEH